MSNKLLNTYIYPQDLFISLPANLISTSDIDSATVILSGDLNLELPKNTFKIYVCDALPSAQVGQKYDAWVVKNDTDSLARLLQENESAVDSVLKTNENIREIAKYALYSTINIGNCLMSKDYMSTSISGIRDIFEEQQKAMRFIHNEIKSHQQSLIGVKDINDRLQQESLLDESILAASDILKRIDDVIEAMYGFVNILQFEDRVTQILDGMSKVMQESVRELYNYCPSLSQACEKALRERLTKNYTIQEQRDFALGLEVNLRYYEAVPSIEDEVLFF